MRIDGNGAVTLIVDKCEVGQAVYTALPMLLAEELEVSLDQVILEPAPPNEKLYADPLLHFQATGNSTSVRASYERLRYAGAAARTMLVRAAAQRWQARPEECRAERGAVIHQRTGRRLSYGALAAAAAKLQVPEQPVLKAPQEFKLIGTSPLRLDLRDKVNGRAQYGIDLKLPDMKYASIKACPVFGGKLAAVDDLKAITMPGVIKVVRLEDAVAVIAANTWQAMKALAALDVEWNEGEHGKTTMQGIVAQLDAASRQRGVLAHEEGDVAKAMAGASARIEAVYQAPFLAHAPMEPPTCAAHVRKDGCDVWTATQVPARAQDTAARASGLPLDKVTIHNLQAGGAFGRRLETDFIDRAVRIAREVSMPVNLIWTREEDLRRDWYRPYYYDRISAGLDAKGLPVAWNHRIAGSSVMARFAPQALGPNGLDPDAVECAAQPIYNFPSYFVDYVRQEPFNVPTSFWRGVGPTHNVFVVESFLDECAVAANQDPVAYRRALLQQTPRALKVLDTAAEAAGWWQPLAAGSGSGRGVAVVYVFDTYLALVVQVAVATGGEVSIQRVVCAVDCGVAVHPDQVKAQIEGGVLFGLSGALYGEITIDRGRVQQSNFHDYRTLRMSETPPVEVHLIQSQEPPGGIGETGTVGAAPALGNAIFAATGIRVRKMPVTGHELWKVA